MNIYIFEKKQIIKGVNLDHIWDFFSNPKNLSKITPKYMGFEILEKDLSKIYPGQIIQYYVTPLLGIKLKWVTEITYVNELNYFVDEQRFGPYSFWHHKHFFKILNENEIEINDLVHYGISFGFFGKLINKFIVKRKLVEIFNFRTTRINEIFKID